MSRELVAALPKAADAVVMELKASGAKQTK
jgi:hypothetical protein